MTAAVIRRALAAYGWSDGEPLPTSARSETADGLQYVVLRRGRRVLACYRVRNDGKLKRIIRIPTFVDEEAELRELVKVRAARLRSKRH